VCQHDGTGLAPRGGPYPERPPAPSELHEHVRATTVRVMDPKAFSYLAFSESGQGCW